MTETEQLIPILKWHADEPDPVIMRFIQRPATDPAAGRLAETVLEDIRKRGNTALLECIHRFDSTEVTVENIRVTRPEIMRAREMVDNDFKNAATDAHRRISAFSKAGMRKEWSIPTAKGGMVGEQFVPYDRIGAYIPGGAAPLASTALMTVTLAKVAGVQEIVACTPAAKDGSVNPYLLFALDLAGATEIYKIGGIQSVAAMAYGTETIAPVQKIVGPGGPYVTAAKRLVYGTVALDMVAGPSEIAVLADDTAKAEHVAADLLSQAEHGSGHEKVLFVTPSRRLAADVREAMLRQTEQLSRKEAIMKVLQVGTMIVVADRIDDGMELCNLFAPEHFELMIREPRMWVKKVRAAGAIFVGPWTPECAGDFAAGPSHVLPTGGTASFFSGLTVDDFLRRSSVISLTRADLQEMLPVIDAFGRVEGLDAHTRSAQIRFDK
ncbi:MAG: histidinol dehydrogenase [Spartobacteria bacterium]|nr:histidinol dehydrogenase [Spartobacteria bacterium]